MCSSQCWLTAGAILAGLAVAAGAFAAHGLDGYFHKQHAGQTFEKKVKIDGDERVVTTLPLAEKYLADFRTAAEYQMYHALALLAVGLVAPARPGRLLSIAGLCFVAGIVGFSGGLYAYTLTGMKEIVWIIPVGGLFFLLGWITFAAAVCSCVRQMTTATSAR